MNEARELTRRRGGRGDDRLMNLPVGLLINFGNATLKQGLHRIVNKLLFSASPRLRVNQSPIL